MKINDSRTGVNLTISPHGHMLIANLVRLIGGNLEGAALDTNVWTTSVANAGTVVAANGISTVSTNTNANGSALLQSIDTGRFVNGVSNNFLGGIRLGDTGVTNNVRRWGAYDANNGVFFQLNGTTAQIGVRSGGSDTLVSSFNGQDAFTVDTNFHTYEVLYHAGRAVFIQDRKLIHTYIPSTTALTANMAFKLSFESINSSGATTNCQLFVRGVSLTRLGAVDIRPNFYRVNTAESRVLKSRAGTLQRVIVNTKGGNASTLTLFDNSAASGTVIGVIDLQNAPGGSFEYDLDFSVGLAYTTAGTTVGDITIVYN